MAMKLGAVILDSTDPERLAAFYSELTGWIWMTDPEGNEFCFCSSCGSSA